MAAVADFYRGKVVLITGATGFMGKVLVEKLLRSCPDVATLYVLLRPKGGHDVSERLELMLKAQLFEHLRTSAPSRLEKVVAVSGDIMQLGLGLSSADRTRLEEEVDIIFHSAATVRFNEELKMSININLRGTQSLLHLAKNMARLKAFIHVSTAFCNCDREVIDEVVYPSPEDPRQVMDTVGWLKDDVIAAMTPKLIGKLPNTYTFTKALTETLIADEKESLPVAIVRPPIVACAWKEPIPGWIDNLNGPTGMIALAGKGLMSYQHYHKELVTDIMPVDVTINLMITAAWHMGTNRPRDLPIYNCTSGMTRPLNVGDALHWIYAEVRRNPICRPLWYPVNRCTRTLMVWNFWFVTCDLLPSYVIDGIGRLFGRTPRLVKACKSSSRATQHFGYFLTHQWQIKNTNMSLLWDQMSEHDHSEFNFDIRDLDWKEYISIYCQGVRQFIFKDKDTVEFNRRYMKMMYHLHHASRLLLFLLAWRVLLSRSSRVRGLCTTLVGLLRQLMALCVSALVGR